MAKKTLQLLVKTRDETLFDGAVLSVTSVNKVGTFDILESHANFISLIQEKLVVREEGGGKKEFPVESGLVKISRDKIEIYLGIRKFLTK